VIQTLEDAVRDAGLTPCLFVRVRCPKHGEFRVAMENPKHECPHCAEPAACFVLGKGGTRRAVVLESEEVFRQLFRLYDSQFPV
jgi:hypothetical protein